MKIVLFYNRRGTFVMKSLLYQLVYITDWRPRVKAHLHYGRKRERTVHISSKRIWTLISFDLIATYSNSIKDEPMVLMNFCSRSAYHLHLYVGAF